MRQVAAADVSRRLASGCRAVSDVREAAPPDCVSKRTPGIGLVKRARQVELSNAPTVDVLERACCIARRERALQRRIERRSAISRSLIGSDGLSIATPPPWHRLAPGLVGGDPLFHHRPEMPDQALDRPGRGIAQRADRVAFDLPRHLVQRVDLLELGAALAPCGPSPAIIQPVPSRHGVHWPQLSCL